MNQSRMMMMMAVVIMRQSRTVMKDMKVSMVMRMTAVIVVLMIKIQAVEADDSGDADGRDERYFDIVGFFRVVLQRGLHKHVSVTSEEWAIVPWVSLGPK